MFGLVAETGRPSWLSLVVVTCVQSRPQPALELRELRVRAGALDVQSCHALAAALPVRALLARTSLH